MTRPVEDDYSRHMTLLTRLRQVRAKRILLTAAVVVIIALVVTNGFVDFPRDAAQIFVFDRLKAQTPDQASQNIGNWKLRDQLELKSSESYSVTIQVVDRSTDLVRWLVYHKSSMLIEASVWAKCAPNYPGLAIVILDSDGLIRGYRFLDLTYFTDMPLTNQYGFCYPNMPEFRTVVDFIYNVPADMKLMKIWGLFYTGIAQYPQNQGPNPIVSGPQTVDFGAVELPYNLQATEKTDYAYQSYDDLRIQIIWQFFRLVAILGWAFDLIVVRRVPRLDPLYPFLVYFLLFMIGLVGLLWSFSR